ncbi:GNAT family N-acetyltransferase [Breoghania sp.]|uniref:GNAT family N-acetyltransferase n=1 Tax=Breoghania sp. TaxID=2065378 RepID=UPI002623C533|nr:GNAT family N-acetyltransferase [Breoghania sp.]MDJ0933308.1 GNAT family N-acetyltransferase [Breoghania sp.]
MEGEKYEDPNPLAAARPALTLEHLKLDRPTMDDAADIVFLANNRHVAEMLARMPHPYGLADARKWIESTYSLEHGTTNFAVRLKSIGRIIGACGYQFGPVGHGSEPELGYWIGKPFWGHGYATEAAQAIIDHAFTVTGHRAILASCRLTNPASRRVIEKCGFQYSESGMMRSLAHGDVTVPVETYRLDRKTWEALKGWSTVG